MTEATIRGLIQGGAFLILGLLATLIWKLLRSKSEGARRLKWVLGVGGTLLVAFGFSGNTTEALVLLTIAAVAFWVYKGFKRKA